MRSVSKAIWGALAVPLLISACVAEPRVLVVPDEGSQLESGVDLASDVNNFDEDVEVLREEIAPGQVFDGTRYWYVAELKNNSQSTVYTFTSYIDAFDGDDNVRAANIVTPEIEIAPGETVLFFERMVDNLFESDPVRLEVTTRAQSARAVTESDVKPLSVGAIDWSSSTDYFGDRDFVVSGTVTNDSDTPISHFRVDVWCGNSAGEYFVMPSQAFTGGNTTLAPGSQVSFLTDMYTEIDMSVEYCDATVVRAGPKEYGPGVQVNDLRDSTAEVDNEDG